MLQQKVNFKLISSSSGVKSVDKREGGGSHNWGTFEDDIKADDDKANTSTDDVLNESAVAPENGAEAMQTESGGEESKEPEEPKVLTHFYRHCQGAISWS